MTPLSWNSSQRSLPSRVRSPTPPNTDTPPCFSAMLWISSMMTTVLPTPAPPNRPILPPCRYGSSRSMTLMPVSNIFSSVDWSSRVGGGRWIGQRSFDCTGPIRKVDRLAEHVQHAAERLRADRHRDRLAEIDRPSCPRCMPSVGFIATARTRFSPRCCSTSAMTSIALAAALRRRTGCAGRCRSPAGGRPRTRRRRPGR